MLNEFNIRDLLKEALKEYIRLLEINSLSYAEVKGQIQAYCKVLEINIDYLNLEKAKEMIKELE